MSDGQSEARKALESKHDNILKVVKNLEGGGWPLIIWPRSKLDRVPILRISASKLLASLTATTRQKKKLIPSSFLERRQMTKLHK